MAGGEGAKERRRLKRLQTEAGGETKKKDNTRVSFKDSRRNGNPRRKDAPFKKKQFDKKPHIKKNKNNNSPPAKQKKSKIKKPKHLKRKLEQAVQSDDVESKK